MIFEPNIDPNGDDGFTILLNIGIWMLLFFSWITINEFQIFAIALACVASISTIVINIIKFLKTHKK
jgi:hypothetical protein